MAKHTKYPRTTHFSWSRGRTPDDVKGNYEDQNKDWQMGDIGTDYPSEIVITEKLDGENTNMYHDHIHARSMDSISHPSREWVKRIWGEIAYQIPENMKICGENVYGQHSIRYDRLTSFFYVFGICEWSEHLQEYKFLTWDETVEWCQLLGLEHAPVLYRGHFPVFKHQWQKIHDQCWTGVSAFGDEQEGYVSRNAESFYESEFGDNVGKFVRENHVKTDEFWMKNWVPNKLKDNDE